MRPRSLFDRVDLAALRSRATRLTGPEATVLACLSAGGAVEHDPSDPAWPDRDRLIVGSPGLRAAAEAAGCHPEDDRADPLTLARDSQRAGAIYRVWWLPSQDARAAGEAWPIAAAAAEQGLDALICIALPPAGDAVGIAGLWRAAGWRVLDVDAGDLVEVLGALDRAMAPDGRPAAIVAAPRR